MLMVSQKYDTELNPAQGINHKALISLLPLVQYFDLLYDDLLESSLFTYIISILTHLCLSSHYC